MWVWVREEGRAGRCGCGCECGLNGLCRKQEQASTPRPSAATGVFGILHDLLTPN